MKYTLENLHFNHVWSSAFQKWFCLTTSDLSFREVSFRRMPTFKIQVNQTQTNFPGGCNKPDKRLTHSALTSVLYQVYPCSLQDSKMLHVDPQFSTGCREDSSKSLHVTCWNKLWLELPTWLNISLQRLILCPSQPVLPESPNHPGLHRIVVPCFILDITISWCYLKLSFARKLELMNE